MSGAPGSSASGGNTNFAYKDHDKSYQYASSNWSSSSHGNAPNGYAQPQHQPQPQYQQQLMFQAAPLMSAHPQMQLPAMEMAQQHHQQAMAIHQSVAQSIQQSMQHHQSMMQNNFQSVLPPPFQSLPSHTQQPAPIQYAPPPQIMASRHQSHYAPQLQIAASHQGCITESDESSDDDSDDSHDAHHRQRNERHRKLVERQAAMEKMMAAGADRVRKLEERDSKAEHERQQKTREIEALKKKEREREQEIARLQQEKEQAMQQQLVTQQQMLLQQQRHQTKISEIMKTNASSPGFDLSAMSEMLTQIVQRDRDKSVENLKKSLGEQLSGVARASDIEKAAMHLDKKFEKLPVGATPNQVENAVRGEIDSLMQKAANRMSKQQQRIEPPTKAARYQSSLEVEEIPEPDHTKPMRAPEACAAKPLSQPDLQRQRTLSHASTVSAAAKSLTKTSPAQKATVDSMPGTEIKPSKSHKLKDPATTDAALTTVKRSDKPTSFPVIAGPSSQPTTSKKTQRILAATAPSVVETAMVQSSTLAIAEGGQALKSIDAKAAVMVPPHNAISRVKNFEGKSNSSAQASSAITEGTPTRTGGQALKSIDVKAAVTIVPQDALSRVKKSESRSSSSAQASSSSPANNALMRPKTGGKSTHQSSPQGATTLPQLSSNQLSKRPITTSPSSSHQQPIAGVQARSDGATGPASKQLTHTVPEAEQSVSALVKTSRDVSKKEKRHASP